MENINWNIIFINFVITAFLYMAVPLIIYLNDKREKYTKKKILLIVIANSIIVSMCFCIIRSILGTFDKINILPPIFYGCINYALLHKFENKEIEVLKDDEENKKLEKFINLYEKNNTKEKTE